MYIEYLPGIPATFDARRCVHGRIDTPAGRRPSVRAWRWQVDARRCGMTVHSEHHNSSTTSAGSATLVRRAARPIRSARKPPSRPRMLPIPAPILGIPTLAHLRTQRKKAAIFFSRSVPRNIPRRAYLSGSSRRSLDARHPKTRPLPASPKVRDNGADADAQQQNFFKRNVVYGEQHSFFLPDPRSAWTRECCHICF